MSANFKSLMQRKPSKDQRERLILLGLVELYLQDGKPVGSNTLRKNGFENLSSATIRNYFSRLEENGYLKQQHSSGGRIPTQAAYRLYAESFLKAPLLEEKEKKKLKVELQQQTREIAEYLQHAAETISSQTRCAVFLSAPRFDQDFILDIKLVSIDNNRCLCVLITDFGLVHSEVLYARKKLTAHTLKRLEAYFHWRITNREKPLLSEEEEALASEFYREIMLRHIVSYTNFSAEDIYKTGFSKLLSYPDFNNASALASGLSLFENPTSLRTLLGECCKSQELKCWIGDELQTLAPSVTACSVVAIPYRINNTIAGAVAIFGPSRVSYRKLFGILQQAADCISETLTKSIYKFKITFRQPNPHRLDFKNDQTHCLLLEDKTQLI